MNPEQKRNDRVRGVADALIDAVVCANTGQRLAVIFWKQSLQRDGTGSDSVRRVIAGEQLHSDPP